MKTISELRTTLTFQPQEINSSIKFFAEKVNIDFDVWLPTKKLSLQRDYVWDLEQKRELIWSILMNRHIPRMAMVCTEDSVYQVIDGKQRLSTMLDFYAGKFSLLIDGVEYYFLALPKDYQNVIQHYYFAYYIVHEDRNTITDQQKIDWFKFINFAGTLQEQEHFTRLSSGNFQETKKL